MSLKDRTENIKFVDKATEFKMSEEWQRQWAHFDALCSNLNQRAVSVFSLSDNTVALTDSEQNLVIKGADDYDGITVDEIKWCTGNKGTPYLPMNLIRKQYLSFNRKANYDWCRLRAESAVLDYQHMRERLIGYEEHLELPEIPAPKLEGELLAPFVKEASDAINSWLAVRYDYERHTIKMLPSPILNLHRETKFDIEGEKLELYEVTKLLKTLLEIHSKYDIETSFARAANSVYGLKKMFGNGVED